MEIETRDIERIVRQVMAAMEQQGTIAGGAYPPAPGTPGPRGDNGDFERVEDAIDAAYAAGREWAFHYKVEDRRRVIEAIRVMARENARTLAQMVRDETGMGRMEDKIEKHLAVADKTPGVECLTTDAISGDGGLMIEEYAPFGVIGAEIPWCSTCTRERKSAAPSVCSCCTRPLWRTAGLPI